MNAKKADMVRFYAPERVHCAFMRLILLSCWIGVVALLGCGDQKQPVSAATSLPEVAPAANDPYEQLRAGIFRIDASLQSIEDAFKEAKSTESTSLDLRQSLEDIQASIDSAGEILAEEAATPPQKGLDVAEYDKRRSKLVELVNDALHDLRDARGIVDSLAGPEDLGPLEPIGVKLDVAMEDLRSALEALGGKESVD